MTMEARLPRVKATYGYYRQPNGWVTCSPIAPLDELRYRQRGWEPLKKYGSVEIRDAYTADHPLEPLFMAGGAPELPHDQVVAMGFHVDPPVIPGCRTRLSQFHPRHREECWEERITVEFPQLTGDEEGPFPCHFCGEDRAPFPTRAAQAQHETAVHKEERMGLRQADALAAGNRELIAALTGNHAPVELAAAAAPAAIGPNDELYAFVCGFGCGYRTNDVDELYGHVQEAHLGNQG